MLLGVLLGNAMLGEYVGKSLLQSYCSPGGPPLKKVVNNESIKFP